MKQDKTWGGNIELQAMSLLFQINIAIHQLNSPRWEIVNFAGGKTIHLSYHDGDHYASGTCCALTKALLRPCVRCVRPAHFLLFSVHPSASHW